MPFGNPLPSPPGSGMDTWSGNPNPTSEELEWEYEKGMNVPKTNIKGEPYYHLKSGIRKRNVWTTEKVGTYMTDEMAVDPEKSGAGAWVKHILALATFWGIQLSHIIGIPILFLYFAPFWIKYWVFSYWLYKHWFSPRQYVTEDVPVPKCAKDWGKRVCIVGCGASGTVMCKELKEVTDDFVCYERLEAHGGIFYHIFPFYMTSSSQTTAWWTDWSQPHLLDPFYWTSDQFCDYMRICLTRSGAWDHVKFGHDVVSISLTDDDRVEVTVRVKATGREFTEIFEHVIICSGSHATPKRHMEKTPGMQENFKGTFCYGYDINGESEEYYKGKNVIMCGAGEYGAHIASSLAPLCKNFWISIRSLPGHQLCRYIKWDEPREEVPKCDRWLCHNVDYDFNYALFGATYKEFTAVAFFLVNTVLSYLTIYDGGKYWKHLKRQFEINSGIGNGLCRYGTKAAGLIIAAGMFDAKMVGQIMEIDENNVVHMESGEKLEDIDVIVAATGMTNDFVKWILDPEIYDRLGSHRDRMFHTIHPDLGSKLMFCGFQRPAVGSIPSLSETQARFISRIISGSLPTPSRDDVIASVKEWRSYHLRILGEHQSETIPSLVDWLWAQKSMYTYMGNCPDLWDLFWTDPWLWQRWIFCAGNNIMWRLVGVGAKADAHKRLRMHPAAALWIQGSLAVSWFWSFIEAWTVGSYLAHRNDATFRFKNHIDEYYQLNRAGLADRSSWLY